MKGLGFFHMHKRMRAINRAFEPYPSPRFWVRVLDKTAILAGILGPLMTVPQIWKIYHYQNATGVSALSWGAFAMLDIPFIIYGIVHRNKLIKITYIGWLIVNTAVAVGAIIYG